MSYDTNNGNLLTVTQPDPDGAGPLTSPVTTYRGQGSGVRGQNHALRKASGRATQNPSKVCGISDSFTARIFFLMDERIRESAQLALHDRLASRLLGFVQRAHGFQGVSAYA